MTDERNDRREGYADGLADKYQAYRSPAYQDAWDEGDLDWARAHFQHRPLSLFWRIYLRIARIWA